MQTTQVEFAFSEVVPGLSHLDAVFAILFGQTQHDAAQIDFLAFTSYFIENLVQRNFVVFRIFRVGRIGECVR